jgi:oligopeptide/dipeptide ABC transporter ATP-binding protein
VKRGAAVGDTNRELLRVENLKVDLMTGRGIVYAVDGVSFSVRRGEIHGIVGESGCGKSVTSKAIMGLFDKKRSRVSGKVFLEEANLLTLPEKTMRHIRGNRISMIFQDPMTSLSPLMTIGAQIEETIANHTRLSAEERRRRALSLLERVGLNPAADRARQYPFELSGGMQQRVMIAQAIACEPELLIADEPTTALDVTIQAQILALLRELQQELGMAVLLITHNFGVVAEICDRVSVMYAGRIVETADTKTLLSSPAHPYSRLLMGCIPQGHAGRKEGKNRLRVIAGSPPQLRRRSEGCPFEKRCTETSEHCKCTPTLRFFAEEHAVLCHHAQAGGEKEEDARERSFA